MLILTILVVVLILSLIICNKAGYYSQWYVVGQIGAAISAMLLGLSLLCCFVEHITTKGTINEIEVVRQAVEEAREKGVGEQAGLILIKAETNKELILYKTYNDTIWDIWNPDEICELELIK